jgi:hypothetical protein
MEASMFPIRIGLASQSASIDFSALSKAANAINLQVTRDFAPIWNVNATVVALEDPNSIPPGVWPVFLVDDIGMDGALGFHLNDHNQPYARARTGPTWSLTASHEVLEMLADPSGNRLISSTSVQIVDDELQDGGGKFEYLVEVCDPSEDPANAYLVDDVLVSDFYTPRYFDTVATTSARYSFSGKITRPRQLLANGYLSWINPVTQTLQQARAFGTPDIIDRGRISLAPPGSPASSLRGTVDRLTSSPVRLSRVPVGLSIVTKQAERSSFLSDANRARGASYASAAQSSTLAATAFAMPSGEPVYQEAAMPPVLDQSATEAFSVPGVISARVGHELVDGWITDKLAYVVIARPEALDTVRAAIPSQIGGVPVDVRAATSVDLLAADRPEAYAVMADARHELRKPRFDDEVLFDVDGRPVEDPLGPLAFLAARRPAKPQTQYQPAGVPLDAIEDDFVLRLNASPDSGWAELEQFLRGARRRLVVGMYDFTSAHILQTVEATLSAGSMMMTLDHPAPNPSSDQTDEQTVSDLQQKIAEFSSAWALTNSDPKAASWIYPNAYHIKVAVREDDMIWLSSGNWNNSNQPIIDLADQEAAFKIAKNHDRDWHVIATNKKLADMFRAYLEHDFEVASANQVDPIAAAQMAAATPDVPPIADLQVPEDIFAAGRTFRQLFPAKTISGHLKVQPLLTPDNYHDHVLALIQSAKKRFYMQTQYIHPGSGPDDGLHNELIAAVQALIAGGLDVRLICSQFETADWVEKLSAAGLDTSVLRIQPNVHNKGIVVDSETVMVSSQNWSADGTLRNRDAGLIIWNADAATYFEKIFLHDWENLAAQSVIG